MNRYARQMILPEIGEKGQARLADARVLVIGAGGLGSPVLQYLAGAGAGHISIVDPDHVEQSNLHRQPLFNEMHIGQSKAKAAQQILGKLNPDISIEAHVTSFDASNAKTLCEGMTIIFDCADNFAATYVASDLCQEEGVPLISASALSANGYVGGFCGGKPSIRAVFPDLPSNLATCATAGVMGPVVGTIGAMQAQMGLSVILGLDPSPLGRLVSFDGITFNTGSFRFDNAPEPEAAAFPFVAVSDISPQDYVVELRTNEEVATPITENAERLIADDFLESRPMPIPNTTKTIFVCRSGLRAWKAAKHLNRWWNGPIALVAAGNPTGENT